MIGNQFCVKFPLCRSQVRVLLMAGFILVQGFVHQHQRRCLHSGKARSLLSYQLAPFSTRRRLILSATRSPSNRKRRRLFDDYLPRLQEYHRNHGHSNVTAHEDEDLFEWIDSIRKRYRTCQHKLSAQRRKELENLDFSWWMPDVVASNSPRGRPRAKPQRRTWEEYFPRLQKYYQSHGHCNVTAKEDRDLYKWTASLRKNYQCQAIVRNVSPSFLASGSLLSDEQFDSLQDMGFSWSTPHVQSESKLRKGVTRWRTWEEYCPRLLEFYEAHGHCNLTLVPEHNEGTKDLAQWVDSLKHRKLAVDKIQLLQQMGITWDIVETRTSQYRREMIDRLHAFYKKTGHVLVKEDDDPELFRWTRMCLRNYGHAYLRRVVEPNHGHKSRNEEKWETMLQCLAEYRRVHGHCSVSLADGNPKLYKFVQNLRQQYRKLVRGEPSQLNGERVEALEQLDFDWGKGHDIRWKERLQELDAFQQIYGHVKVPQKFRNNPQLGRWVMNQRTMKRMNDKGIETSLRQPRINQLEQAEFVWKVHDNQWWDMFEAVKEYHSKNGHLSSNSVDNSRTYMRQWLNEQRYYYRSDKLRHRLTEDRIEALESLPGFRWVCRERSGAPSKDDWSDLMKAMRDKGIAPQAKVKTHWFDGVNPFAQEIKTVWTDEDLMALWNEGIDEDEDDEDYYYEDEDSKNFLRA
ncbi:helicase domain protein [Nitzschia inconspicua]|uniref:Helicase domain protein n=1 Tax=Nitzschia inconspicua TaxID=303405 RepID=A0A9K3LNH8_9STRA|nr:helicase domain protein [Nitzschia inconspicua]